MIQVAIQSQHQKLYVHRGECIYLTRMCMLFSLSLAHNTSHQDGTLPSHKVRHSVLTLPRCTRQHIEEIIALHSTYNLFFFFKYKIVAYEVSFLSMLALSLFYTRTLFSPSIQITELSIFQVYVQVCKSTRYETDARCRKM